MQVRFRSWAALRAASTRCRCSLYPGHVVLFPSRGRLGLDPAESTACRSSRPVVPFSPPVLDDQVLGPHLCLDCKSARQMTVAVPATYLLRILPAGGRSRTSRSTSTPSTWVITVGLRFMNRALLRNGDGGGIHDPNRSRNVTLYNRVPEKSQMLLLFAETWGDQAWNSSGSLQLTYCP